MASSEKIAKKDAIPEHEVPFTTQCPEYDVTFHVEEKHLYAPKLFLSMASPVFKAMLNSDFKEGKGLEVNLPDKNYDDFLLFLQCLHPGLESCVNEESVYKILPLANEYQTARLLKSCENTLKHILNSVTQSYVHTPWSEYYKSRLKITVFAHLYGFADVFNTGVDRLKDANPSYMFSDPLFQSLSANAKFRIAKEGFLYCHQRIK